MNSTPRILFVCFADYPHSQSWISLLQGSQYDVRVYAIPKSFGAKYRPRAYPFPVYELRQPTTRREAKEIFWLLPKNRLLRPVTARLEDRFDLNTYWLKRIILSWRPDIVHSLSFHMGARYTWKALEQIPKSQRPKWIISSWGTEINFGVNIPEDRVELETYVRNCDGLIASCERDYRLALRLGLASREITMGFPVPGPGGIDPVEISAQLPDAKIRRIILIPKAYDSYVNKTLEILEALRLCQDSLSGYQVHLLQCDHTVRRILYQMPEWLQNICHPYDMIPKADVFQLMREARLMIAPSLSDGTANVMLEAMAFGALPIMSPLDSIMEWIEDGKNGLLAHALYPDQIAACIRQGLQDDELFNRASVFNRKIVLERANREIIRSQVLNYYQRVMAQPLSV
jgi:hypothetical protein